MACVSAAAKSQCPWSAAAGRRPRRSARPGQRRPPGAKTPGRLREPQGPEATAPPRGRPQWRLGGVDLLAAARRASQALAAAGGVARLDGAGRSDLGVAGGVGSIMVRRGRLKRSDSQTAARGGRQSHPVEVGRGWLCGDAVARENMRMLSPVEPTGELSGSDWRRPAHQMQASLRPLRLFTPGRASVDFPRSCHLSYLVHVPQTEWQD